MIDLLVSLALSGSISNEDGKIGVAVSKHGWVGAVHPGSPAEKYGIKQGDVILESDNVKGTRNLVGSTSRPVLLKIKRGKEIMYFRVPRVAKDYNKVTRKFKSTEEKL